MILLTVLSVGLLSLSAISLRATSQGEAMSEARANARMALLLALGQLQKGAGPDQRITAPAELKVHGGKNTAGICGAWKSWRPPNTGGSYDAAKQGQFLGYLMSNPEPQNPDPSQLPGGSSTQLLVGPSSVDAQKSLEVSAPVIPLVDDKAVPQGGMAWVTLDEGAKGRVDLLPEDEAKGLGPQITQVGSSARNRFDDVEDADFLAAKDEQLKVSLPKLVSFDEADVAGSKKTGLARYFHDFTVNSASVQADVANGGLKTDLSVLFDNSTLPADYSGRRLYSGTTTAFSGSASAADPLWSLYASYSQLYRRTTAGDNAKDGLKSVIPTRYRLASTIDRNLGNATIYEPNMSTVTEPMLMPTIVRVDVIFSLVTRPAHQGWANSTWAKTYPNVLHLMYLPVVTLHNPYNVPLKFTEIEVEFAQLPIGFQFMVNGQPATSSAELIALNQLYVSNAGTKTFKISLTNSLTSTSEVTMGAGETRIFGTPFPPSWTFAQDAVTGNGVKMFDWGNNMTTGSRMVPGMITTQRYGVGYDVDWLAPTTNASWLSGRKGGSDGMICVRDSDTISVRYGPVVPAGANNKFSVTTRFKTGSRATDVGVTQVFYQNLSRLDTVLKEGTSPRFPEVRTFPETFPKSPSEATVTAQALFERHETPIKDYIHARPFAVFSLGAKTTRESFTKSRPVADTGLSMLMANCDFTTTASQGSSPMEFVLTPIRGGRGMIESDTIKAFFFGGQGATNGTTAATLYEIPAAPLQSIAQLRHANAGSLGSVPYVTYTVGESRAHPAIPAGAVSVVNGNRTALDHSWLANDQLWDAYWFSTLATLQGPGYTGDQACTQKELATKFFNGERSLPNPRNMPYLTAGMSASRVSEESTDPLGRKSAAHMLTRGGLNVNTTSVAAWVSVLSALADSSVPLANGTLETTGDSIPTLRTRRPALSVKSGGNAKDLLWNSYRTLEPKQVELLAQKIVEEIKLRGPFLSMSEFVNRRLEGATDFSQKGALQAAIDKAGINEVMEANADEIRSNDVSGYGWKNPGAIDGNTGAGSPGEISQGDLLSAIGSFISVRSDTFRIRCYGEARDGKGNINARAWCEAVVQRVPEYLDPTNAASDSAATGATLTDANQKFGRRIEVIAFRWLHPEEV